VKTSLDSVDVRERSAAARELRRVVRYGLGLIVVALLITPVAGIQIGISYPLVAMLGAATATVAAVIALLMLVQAQANASLPMAVLSAGFAYATATMVPYGLLFPGMFPGLATAVGASATAVEYLWFLWQAGLLVAILAYQWLRLAERSDPAASTRGRLFIAGLVFAFIVLTPLAIWLPILPPATTAGGHRTEVFSSFMMPVIALLAAASVFETFRGRSRTNVIDVWMMIVSFSIIIEMYLNVTGLAGFTIGWYAARVVVLVATSAVLAVMLWRASRRFADLVERAEVLEGEAHTDILTGLPNRRRFDEEFARAFGSAIRRSSPIGVAIVDIDHFKNYNDAFGHQAGDGALRRIAEAIAESVERSGDFAARYGGEEFVVILEDTTLAGAAGVGERIRNAVLDAGIAAPSGGLLSVSVGVAARLPGSTGEALLRQADAALYDAKNAGRNRVASWRSVESAPIGSAFDDLVQ
jgi:diguanylate cyclase (GGDEF)-like protein